MAENLKLLGTVYPAVTGIIVSGYENTEDFLRIFDKDYSGVLGIVATNTNLENRTYLYSAEGPKTSEDLIIGAGTVTVPAGIYVENAYAEFTKYDGTVV